MSGRPFSPAFSGGLIEARPRPACTAAGWQFSPAFSGGLIEAPRCSIWPSSRVEFSPAFSGGLIEARAPLVSVAVSVYVFPRVQRGPH